MLLKYNDLDLVYSLEIVLERAEGNFFPIAVFYLLGVIMLLRSRWLERPIRGPERPASS